MSFDFLTTHPNWEDHSSELQSRQRVADMQPKGEEDDRGSGRMTDSDFVLKLAHAIQDGQVFLSPRIGAPSTYNSLIKHLGDRATEVA